jgi:FHS family L-fucose permease-like MFS transporter
MKNYIFPLVIIGVLFGVFGFAAWLNSILVPYFQITLQLTTVQTTLVTFAFFIAYVVMALPSAWVLKKVGFKSGLVIGLVVLALGSLLFIPAAYMRTYWLFLTALFVMGSGQALLQTAANPYVTLLGPMESAAQRNSFMGVCNKLAGIVSQRFVGPILLLNADALLIKLTHVNGFEKDTILKEMSLRVVTPYWLITGFLVLLSVVIYFVKLPPVADDESEEIQQGKRTSIWLYPNLMLGVLALFCAEGTESITSYYIIPYGQSMGFTTQYSQNFVDYIIYIMLAGYFCGIFFIPKYISQKNALAVCSFLGMCFAIGAICTHGIVSVACVLCMGFCNSLNWPCIWPLAIDGLGGYIKTASAFLIMAIAGDALLPIFYAQLNEWFHIKAGLGLIFILYAVIFYYAVYGHKINLWKFIKHKDPLFASAPLSKTI